MPTAAEEQSTCSGNQDAKYALNPSSPFVRQIQEIEHPPSQPCRNRRNTMQYDGPPFAITPRRPGLLVFYGVEVVAHELVHLEHVHLCLFKHGIHLVVAEDLSLVAGVLELVGLDMLP